MSKLLNFENDNLILAHKPAGVSTHRPSEKHRGFVEWLSQKCQQSLLVCHRLDKETSGGLVFAKDKHSACQMMHLFENHLVSKEYLFISTKKSPAEVWEVKKEKAKDTPGGECPVQKKEVYSSHTRFQRVTAHGTHYLYKAHPLTGKTHQIRKHAAKSGIPILGDTTYGGEDFPRLMLHSLKLSFVFNDQEINHEFQPSRLFNDLSLLADQQLCAWIVGYERREVLYPDKVRSEQALRLLHSETGDLRWDQVGERNVLGWWKSEAPKDHERKKIQALMDRLEVDNWVFQWRPGASQAPEAPPVLLASQSQSEQPWSFKENSVHYEGAHDKGHNIGLFFDQRERREWVLKQSAGQAVLNLFAFTCGFSVNAALAGARQVVSVDLFNKYLQWGQQNFLLNDLDPKKEMYEFRCMDVLQYLEYANKKQLQFDMIVCDPPSFSRHKKQKGVFRIDKDYKSLLTSCEAILSEKGVLLFSTNYEKWSLDRWSQKLTEWAGLHNMEISSVSPSQWDYEWQNQEANLKAFFLTRACPKDHLQV